MSSGNLIQVSTFSKRKAGRHFAPPHLGSDTGPCSRGSQAWGGPGPADLLPQEQLLVVLEGGAQRLGLGGHQRGEAGVVVLVGQEALVPVGLLFLAAVSHVPVLVPEGGHRAQLVPEQGVLGGREQARSPAGTGCSLCPKNSTESQSIGKPWLGNHVNIPLSSLALESFF